MKRFILHTFLMVLLFSTQLFSQDNSYKISPGNFSIYANSSGIFNNRNLQNFPGVEWPRGSNEYIIYTSGLSIACKINDSLAMSTATWKGEFAFGTVENGLAYKDSAFRFYKVNKYDTYTNSLDYVNWGNMVPYGAPFTDIDGNGKYDYKIDKPGVPGANETIFYCLTDAFPYSHSTGEGFGGGITSPMLKAQVAITVWGYSNAVFQDAYFVRYEITNKSDNIWKSTHLGLFSVPEFGEDLGLRSGCDTNLNLGYAYSGYTILEPYGNTPPACGHLLLRSPTLNSDTLGLTSFNMIYNTSSSPSPCVADANGEPGPAYNILKGVKKDHTPILNPEITAGSRITKFYFPGDPVSNAGWIDSKGFINNCGRDTNLNIITNSYPGYRRIFLNTGHDSLNIYPDQKIVYAYATIIKRGYSNLNSISQLKTFAKRVKIYYNLEVDDKIFESYNPDNIILPDKFNLYQNYPNPFNPVTKIKFDVPKKTFVALEVFDMSGRLISVMIKKEIEVGQYEIPFEAINLSSGIYFYRLKTDAVMISKKMLLLK